MGLENTKAWKRPTNPVEVRAISHHSFPAVLKPRTTHLIFCECFTPRKRANFGASARRAHARRVHARRARTRPFYGIIARAMRKTCALHRPLLGTGFERSLGVRNKTFVGFEKTSTVSPPPRPIYYLRPYLLSPFYVLQS